MFCIQNGSPGAALPCVRGEEHVEPRPLAVEESKPKRVLATTRTLHKVRWNMARATL